MKQQFIVTLEIPRGCGKRVARQYIEDAVGGWCGQFHPEDERFELGDKVEVIIKPKDNDASVAYEEGCIDTRKGLLNMNGITALSIAMELRGKWTRLKGEKDTEKVKRIHKVFMHHMKEQIESQDNQIANLIKNA